MYDVPICFLLNITWEVLFKQSVYIFQLCIFFTLYFYNTYSKRIPSIYPAMEIIRCRALINIICTEWYCWLLSHTTVQFHTPIITFTHNFLFNTLLLIYHTTAFFTHHWVLLHTTDCFTHYWLLLNVTGKFYTTGDFQRPLVTFTYYWLLPLTTG